ncbi:MAG: signal recognition particle protein, partial [Alphaproteobacteria bacterium]|nr:signal recognition particle protein [Alphaproteobacteria bacterium]
GDVVSLVEHALETVDKDEAEAMAERVLKQGRFDFNDMAKQLHQVRRMGGLSGMMALMPGLGKIKEQMKNASIDDRLIKRQEAIIQSMTAAERKNADLLQASRKRRIANGAGVSVAEVNRLIKQFLEMQKVLKHLRKMGPMGALSSLMPSFKGVF